ncbi:DNA-directed DNA polymerase [Tanacetum coccineum]
MLRNCHGHNLSKGNIIKIFYHGLSEITQEVLNVAAGGIFLYKTPNQAYQLLEDKVLLKLDDTCFSIDVINEILEEDFDALLDEGSKILYSIEGTLLEEEIFSEFDEFMAMTTDENSESESDTEEPPFEKITINTDYKIKTSLKEPTTDLELKPLPDNLEYEAFSWKTTDIPGICPSFCKHKIQLPDDKKPVVQKQRRLNPSMQEVVTKEIVKLLDTGIIYPIADSPWVSLIHCVQGEGGITVVTNALMNLFQQEPLRVGEQMPFELCNAPATFQRCMLAIFYDMIEESVEVFMDDFSVFGDSFDKCLNNLDKMRQHCKDAHLILNWEKCHVVVKEGIKIKDKKEEKFVEVTLSRIENDESSDDNEVDDNFPGETLMEINTRNEQFSEVVLTFYLRVLSVACLLSQGGTMTMSLMHQWHDTICGGVIGLRRSLLERMDAIPDTLFRSSSGLSIGALDHLFQLVGNSLIIPYPIHMSRDPFRTKREDGI